MPLDVFADDFTHLCIDPSLNFYDGKCRFLIEGQYKVNGLLATPIVVDKPMRVDSRRYIDMMFGNSVLGRALHRVFQTCPNNIEVHAMPRADATSNADAAAVYTITVATTATSSVTYDLAVGPWTIPLPITSGQTAAQIATALAALFPDDDAFPFEVAVNGAVLTLTARSSGVSGNLLTTGALTSSATTTFTTAQTTAGAGVSKALYKMLVAGPAGSDGAIDLFLGNDDYAANGVIVSEGDTASDIAAAIAAEIPAILPYTVSQFGDVITFEAVNAGTVGNFLNPVINWRGYQNYYPDGVDITVTRLKTGAVDPEAPDYETAFGDCCFNVFALLSGDRTWQRGLKTYLDSKWSCTRPQCFGQGFTYNAGSLGTVLATFENAHVLQKLAIPTSEVNFPWEIVATQAALAACSAVEHPELSIQGPENGLLSVIKRPMSCQLPWAYEDMVQLTEKGFCTFVPVGLGQTQLTSIYITNDITNFLYDDLNRPNETFRDAASCRLVADTAVKIATELRQYSGLAVFTRNTKVKPGVKGTNPNMIMAAVHDWARLQVGTLFSEFDDITKDIVLKTDAQVKPPCQGVPGKMNLKFRYRQPVRIKGFDVTQQPFLLENCAR